MTTLLSSTGLVTNGLVVMIGKTYRNAGGELRHITVKHNETTCEFETGRRFQDDRSAFYAADGTCRMTNHAVGVNDHLIEEVGQFVSDDDLAKLNETSDRHVYAAGHEGQAFNTYGAGDGATIIKPNLDEKVVPSMQTIAPTPVTERSDEDIFIALDDQFFVATGVHLFDSKISSLDISNAVIEARVVDMTTPVVEKLVNIYTLHQAVVTVTIGVDLGVGRFYRNGLGQVIVIMAMIDDTHHLYRKGFRYQDNRGNVYRPDGTMNTWLWKNLELKSEVSEMDLTADDLVLIDDHIVEQLTRLYRAENRKNIAIVTAASAVVAATGYGMTMRVLN